MIVWSATRLNGRPRSSRRSTIANALLACTVVHTWWPVIDARSAFCADAASRISPIMMTSGSSRIAFEIAAENWRTRSASVPAFVTAVCTAPSIGYSTGSSTVSTCSLPPASMISPVRMRCRVVDFPDPVGPLMMFMPTGCSLICWSRPACVSLKPSGRRSTLSPASLYSRRSTMTAPSLVGAVAMRTPYSLGGSLSRSEIAASWRSMGLYELSDTDVIAPYSVASRRSPYSRVWTPFGTRSLWMRNHVSVQSLRTRIWMSDARAWQARLSRSLAVTCISECSCCGCAPAPTPW